MMTALSMKTALSIITDELRARTHVLDEFFVDAMLNAMLAVIALIVNARKDFLETRRQDAKRLNVQRMMNVTMTRPVITMSVR